MRRLKDHFLEKLTRVVPLSDKVVLEIGCGDGERSVHLAAACRELVGIDPDDRAIKKANKRSVANARFQIGQADVLLFADDRFDVVVFTLSFHHVPPLLMEQAIDQAVRVVKPGGHIVFLEPGDEGSFFEAEIRFNICDGDERGIKTLAYAAMQKHPSLEAMVELEDETMFKFESIPDFVETMEPEASMPELIEFLNRNGYLLRASRRINIYHPRKQSRAGE